MVPCEERHHIPVITVMQTSICAIAADVCSQAFAADDFSITLYFGSLSP